MRKKDLPIIIVIVVVSAIISYYISGKIIVPPKNRQQQVDVVQAINSNFTTPDPAYFNSKSIDPTQLITIGQNSNTNPFNDTTGQ